MPVRMKGNKLYRTVNERLEDAHGESIKPQGIRSVFTEVVAVGPAVVVLARVTFSDDRQFTGMSQVPFEATSGAEATNPVEVAETSAVGRALAMAGYFGSDEGIAGAEEVRTAQRIQEARQNGQPRPQVAQQEFSRTPEGKALQDSPHALFGALVSRCLQAGYDEARHGGIAQFAEDAGPEHIRPEYERLRLWLKAQQGQQTQQTGRVN